MGRIRVSYGSPTSFAIEPDEVPGVIDEIPGLAALGALLPEGAEMRVHGAAELRVKESDRISCLATGLRALGASVEEYPDGFRLVARPLTGGVGRRRRRSPAGHGVRDRRDRRRPADNHPGRIVGRCLVSGVL